jgi:hypothetical protein
MNERIKELAEQAEQYARDDLIRRRKVGAPLYAEGEYDDIIKQKFAELIVRECCDIVHCKTDESIRVVMAIEQHFGVGE